MTHNHTRTLQPYKVPIVVRDVPATVCSQCGADWIEDSIVARLEEIVNDARKKHHMVEITTLSSVLQ